LEQLPKPPELASLPSSEPSKRTAFYIEKDATGYHIEASELFRVFPAVTPEPVPMEQTATAAELAETAVSFRTRELETSLKRHWNE